MIRFSSYKKLFEDYFKLTETLPEKEKSKDHHYTFYTYSPTFNILLHLQALVCGCVCLYTYFLHLLRVKCIHHGPISSVQFSLSVTSNSLRPQDCSMPGFPVHHQLPEPTQTHVHWVGDAIQPSHPLSSPSPPSFNFSQHQGLFRWVSSLHQVPKELHVYFLGIEIKCYRTIG